MKENKHSLKISRSYFGETTLDGYPIATYSNDELKILKNLLEKVLCEVNETWEGDILQDVDDDDIKYVVIFDVGAFLARKEGLYTSIPLHECVGSLGNDVITYAKVVGNKFDKK